jgi:hypothetical protein
MGKIKYTTDEARRAAQKAAKARYIATDAAKQKAAAYRARARYRSREAVRKYEAEHAEERKSRGEGYRIGRNSKRLAELEVLAGRPRPDFCEICDGNKGGIVFDHCHGKGHFRGWICTKCNNALGMIDDDPGTLRKLIAYLDRNRVNTSPQLTLSGL